jgi:photosystem II stability/assembly factor-like uncharacterized protein
MLKLQYIICFLLCINLAFSQDWEEIGFNGQMLINESILYNPYNGDYSKSFIVSDENIFYASESGLYKSSDMGKEWSKVKEPFENTKVISIVKIDTLLFITSIIGVYKSSDNGNSWRVVLKHKLRNFEYYNYQISEVLKFNGKYIVNSDGVLKESSDYGDTWNDLTINHISLKDWREQIVSGISVIDKYLLIQSQDWFFGKGAIFRTENLVEWESLTGKEGNNNYTSFVFQNNSKDIYNRGILFVAMYQLGVIKSTNLGKSWQTSNQGLPIDGVGYLRCVKTITYSDFVFVVTDSGLFRSTNEGDYWHKVNITKSIDERVTNIYQIENTLFAICGDTSTIYKYIMRSIDNGKTWEYASYGINFIPVNKSFNRFLYNWNTNHFFKYGSGYVFLFGEGLYFSKDGKNWVKYTQLKVGPDIRSLYIQDSAVYITNSSGIFWKNTNSSIGEKINVASNLYPFLAFSKEKEYAWNNASIYSKGYKDTIWTKILPSDSVTQYEDISKVYVWNELVYAVRWGKSNNDDWNKLTQILCSQDEGKTWKNFDITIPNLKSYDYDSDFMLVDSVIIYSSNNGSYKSTNHGKTWIKINEYQVWLNQKNILIGYSVNGTIISYNIGNSWENIPISPNSKIPNVVSESNLLRADWCYIKHEKYNQQSSYIDFCDTIYRRMRLTYISTNYGKTWKQSIDDIYGIPVHLEYQDSVHYLITTGYYNPTLLYRSIDGGERWLKINGALTPRTYNTYTNYYDNPIYDEVYGRQAYQSPIHLLKDSILYLGTIEGLYKINLNTINNGQITTSVLNRTRYCTGDYIEIDYKVERSKSIPKEVWIELSNEYGDFEHATKLPTLSRGQANKLISSIPLDTKPSEYYRVRIATSDSSFYLLDNGHYIQINPQSTVMAINGPDTVSYLSSEIVYFVDYEDGAKYEWEIVSGNAQLLKQSQNIIGLSFGISGTVILKVVKTNKYGCISKDMISITIQAPTNIDDENLFAYSVWPNPSSGSEELSIRFSQAIEHDIELEFVDLLGTVHANTLVERGSDASSLPIQHVQSGVYMLRMKTQNQVFIEKVIVQ